MGETNGDLVEQTFALLRPYGPSVKYMSRAGMADFLSDVVRLPCTHHTVCLGTPCPCLMRLPFHWAGAQLTELGEQRARSLIHDLLKSAIDAFRTYEAMSQRLASLGGPPEGAPWGGDGQVDFVVRMQLQLQFPTAFPGICAERVAARRCRTGRWSTRPRLSACGAWTHLQRKVRVEAAAHLRSA